MRADVIPIDPKIIDAFDAGDPVRILYQASIDRAMGGKPDNALKQMRYYVMHQLAASTMRRLSGHNVVECGCWRGHSTLILASLMDLHRSGSSRFHVFDSFEGLSEFGERDRSSFMAKKAAQDAEREKYASDFDRLAAMVKPLGFVRLHKGWIPQVFDEVDVGAISFANIDVNLYEPTLRSHEFINPRLAPGGIVFFDDYGYKTFPGARAAVDEYLRRVPAPTLFVALPFGSAYLVR
jgi:O-methyltransferase